MPEWKKSDLAKIEGDPWTVADANAMPRSSRLSVAQWGREHDAMGRHLPPAPAAAAVVEWTGAVYQVIRSVGIASVTRVGTGIIDIKLEEAMADIDGYVATGLPTGLVPEHAPVWAYEDMFFARTQIETRLRISRTSAPILETEPDGWVRNPEAVDCSLVIEVWGDRL